MLWFEPPQNETLVSLVQTQDRLSTVNGIYHGYIASELKQYWYVIDEVQAENLNGPFWQTRLIKIKSVTKEYLSAIDGVKKAEESLRAAKKSLELLKESK